MKRIVSIASVLATFLATGIADGQSTQVQLPTFNSFGVNTTVVVPDGGTAFLGGVDSARYGTTSRGVPILGKVPGAGRLFNNRAFGSEVNASRSFARVRIIDLQEMDRAILGSGADVGPYPGAADDPGVRQHRAFDNAARFLSQNVGRRDGAVQRKAKTPDIKPATPASRARALLAKGDQALADGKIELATRFYREAERISNLRD